MGTTQTTPTTTRKTTSPPKTTTSPFSQDFVNLTFTNVQFDAFRQGKINASMFEDEEKCAGQRPNDIIPVVIGAVLAGLIVVTLVVYLIGRHTRKQNPYNDGNNQSSST